MKSVLKMFVIIISGISTLGGVTSDKLEDSTEKKVYTVFIYRTDSSNWLEQPVCILCDDDYIPDRTKSVLDKLRGKGSKPEDIKRYCEAGNEAQNFWCNDSVSAVGFTCYPHLICGLITDFTETKKAPDSEPYNITQETVGEHVVITIESCYIGTTLRVIKSPLPQD